MQTYLLFTGDECVGNCLSGLSAIIIACYLLNGLGHVCEDRMSRCWEQKCTFLHSTFLDHLIAKNFVLCALQLAHLVYSCLPCSVKVL